MTRAFLLAAAAALLASCQAPTTDTLKPRIVVLTDIGPAEVEPDDNESAVRLLAYADRFEIEGLVTTIGWNCDPYPPEWAEYLRRVEDAYEQDVPNLMKRSGQTGFLSAEEEQGAQRRTEAGTRLLAQRRLHPQPVGHGQYPRGHRRHRRGK